MNFRLGKNSIISRKVTAGILMLSLIAVPSCSNESEPKQTDVTQTIQIGDTIENDIPWYNTKRIVLPEIPVNADMVMLSDSLIMTSLENLDNNENIYWQAVCYDFDGNVRWKSEVGENWSSAESANDVSLLQIEDKIYILGTVSGTDMYSEINPADGTEISYGNSQDIAEIGGRPQEIEDLGFTWFKDTVRCGDYTVSSCCSTEGPYIWSYSQGEYRIFDINESIISDGIDDIRSMLPMSDNKVLLVMVDMSSDVLTYVLDLNNMLSEPYEFTGALDGTDALELTWGGENELYIKHMDELYLVDPENMTCNEVYSGSLCNCNLTELDNSTLIKASEEQYVFLSDNGTVYICSKADSNPNVGKKVLEAASVDGLSYEIAEAIYKFNCDNSSCFILYNDEYESGNIPDEHELNRDEELFYITGADLSDKLAVDIMAGEGPDIILNSSEYLQLNNENCLIDLTSYMGELSSSLYFTNIIEASKQNDKLYQMPTSFAFKGLVVDSKSVGDVIGFTYDSYSSFVDGLCNGKDPLSVNNSRIQYMDELINSGFQYLIDEEGTVDTESEALRKLIEYCAGAAEISYNNQNAEQGFTQQEGFEGDNLPINYRSIDNVTEYVNILEDSKILCGLPSDVVRGPSASISSSVGISSSCEVPDIAWEFAVTLLDAEVQSNTEALPISKGAFIEIMDAAVEEHNAMVDRLGDLGGFSKLDADYSLKSRDYLTEITSVTGCDTSMLIIINEEVQAYFAGQKTLDDVCALIQNRCNLVADER